MAYSPVITNHVIQVINTEETIVLPQNTRDFTVRLRNTAQSAKLSFTVGESGTKYMSLNSTFPSINGEDVDLYRNTIFIQSPDIGAVIEVLAYAG